MLSRLAQASRNAAVRMPTRSLQRSQGAMFHAGGRTEEEVKQYYVHDPKKFMKDGQPGFFGQVGLDNPQVLAPLAAIFLGIPLVDGGWYLVDEEAMGAATFFLAMSLARAHGGDALYEVMWEDAAETQKEFEEVENYAIEQYATAIDVFKSMGSMTNEVKDFYGGLIEMRDQISASRGFEIEHDRNRKYIEQLDEIVRAERQLEESVRSDIVTSVTTKVMSSFVTDAKLRSASLDGSLKFLETAEEGADALVQMYDNSLKDVRGKLDAMKGQEVNIPDDLEAARAAKSMEELKKLPSKRKGTFPEFL